VILMVALQLLTAPCRLFTIGDAPRDRLSGAQSHLFCGTLNDLLETLPCPPL